jgi:hypothetical protein
VVCARNFSDVAAVGIMTRRHKTVRENAACCRWSSMAQ